MIEAIHQFAVHHPLLSMTLCIAAGMFAGANLGLLAFAFINIGQNNGENNG